MNRSKSLLFATLLFAAASVAAATENADPSPEVSQAIQPAATEALAGETLFAAAGDCEATSGDLLLDLGLPEPTPAAINCGACSTPNCQGAARGQRCHLGPIIGGWGWCNIYSGGFMCPTGGWECSCGTGPLP